MSGDHRDTANYKKELLINSGFNQIRNSTLFSKGRNLVLSPAVAENQQGYFWFDVREAIISQYKPDYHEIFLVIVRVVPQRFLVFDFSELKKILKTTSKIEKTGKKVWSFVIENRFSKVTNKKSPRETISVNLAEEKEILSILDSI